MNPYNTVMNISVGMCARRQRTPAENASAGRHACTPHAAMPRRDRTSHSDLGTKRLFVSCSGM